MKTRHGKIGRLPVAIRDELNLRLQNGAMGPELLAWLNQLPEVRAVLSQFFDGKDIKKDNLSDWRHGGYEDWLRLQERNLRFQQIAEEGFSLRRHEGAGDVFENFSRMSLAELAVDLDELASLKGDERWKRLQGITREAARLQREYIRSREAELKVASWKYEVRKEGYVFPADRESTVHGPRSEVGEADESKAQGPKSNVSDEDAEVMARKAAEGGQPLERDVSNGGLLYDGRLIYVRQCGGGCVCKTCHPDNGPYTYAEVMRDLAEAKERQTTYFRRGYRMISLTETTCECQCDCERSKVQCPKSKVGEGGESKVHSPQSTVLSPQSTVVSPQSTVGGGKVLVGVGRGGSEGQEESEEDGNQAVRDSRLIYSRQCGYGCICRTCHPDDGKYPYREVMRDLTESRERKSSYFQRGNRWISLTHTWCGCPCDCERSKRSKIWDQSNVQSPRSKVGEGGESTVHSPQSTVGEGG